MRSQLVQWRRGCAPPVLECRRLIERNGAPGRRLELSETPSRRERMSASGQTRHFRDVCCMSGLPPTADISGPGWHFAFVPTCDMAAIDKVQRIASRSDCAAAALCFRGELVLPNILIYAPTAGRAVALRRRVDAPCKAKRRRWPGRRLRRQKSSRTIAVDHRVEE